MQCPKCRYEPAMAEMQQSPHDCVKCGTNYEAQAKHAAEARARRQEEMERNQAQAWGRPDISSGDAAAVSPDVRTAMQDYKGASPVVILDINMSFSSMVRFLVKLTFAAIPAAIIVGVIVFGVISMLGVIGFLMK